MENINCILRKKVVDLIMSETRLDRIEILLILLDKIILEGFQNESDI